MASPLQPTTRLALPSLTLPALALLAPCIAGLVAWELNPRPVPVALPVAEPAARPGPAAPPPDPGTAAATILARPLFDQARRSRPAGTVAAPGVPRLAGVLVSGTERTAILVPPDARAGIAAHEGAVVGGFTVQAISAGTVTLLGPDGLLTLRPSFDRAGSPPSVPVAEPVPVPPSIDED